jgi:hypothetical protein
MRSGQCATRCEQASASDPRSGTCLQKSQPDAHSSLLRAFAVCNHQAPPHSRCPKRPAIVSRNAGPAGARAAFACRLKPQGMGSVPAVARVRLPALETLEPALRRVSTTRPQRWVPRIACPPFAVRARELLAFGAEVAGVRDFDAGAVHVDVGVRRGAGGVNRDVRVWIHGGEHLRQIG